MLKVRIIDGCLNKDKKLKNKSHYAKQYCEYPWTSSTIMAEGNVVPCTQISNNEIVLSSILLNLIPI